MTKKSTLSILKLSTLLLFIIFFTFGQDINYKVHSMYMYHFTRYLDWPENKKSEDFVIGVFGNSPIVSELEAIAISKKAGNQTIVIKKFNSVDDLAVCHILFVSSGKSGEIEKILTATNNKPILLVSEKTGLGKKGTGVNFVIIDDKLKFEINKSSIESHGLKVSVDLLKLGIVL